MLGLPRRPAVLYFHVWTPRRMGFAFYDSPENLIDMLPEYYGLPSLSMRNALYKTVADFTVPADWLWRSDVNHANCLGHRRAPYSPDACITPASPARYGPASPECLLIVFEHFQCQSMYCTSSRWGLTVRLCFALTGFAGFCSELPMAINRHMAHSHRAAVQAA